MKLTNSFMALLRIISNRKFSFQPPKSAHIAMRNFSRFVFDNKFDSFTFSIRSGIANHDGVYVSAITANSLAEQVGLKVNNFNNVS